MRAARVSWERFFDVDVPTALRLDFDGGPVWFVAGMPDASNPEMVSIPGDEIMVVFTASKMRQLGWMDPSFPE